MNFLPVNFEVPSKSSQFMKLEQGQNKFRILSNLVEGYVIFTEDNKPKRKHIKRIDGKIPKECIFSKDELQEIKARKKKDTDVFEDPKYFWLFLVYNHNKQVFQVLEIVQKSVIADMTEYLNQEDWADPFTYDFIVTKKGEGLNTEYSVSTSLPKQLPDEVIDTLSSLEYNLEAVFEGNYPFD
ncbi:MAG: hypothetical protein OHK0045_22580 [Raineya sp.]